jgi:hypothetical protein
MRTQTIGRVALVAGACAVGLARASVRAEVDPASGIDFVTVGAAGNRGYDGPDPFNLTRGRGAVAYEDKIGRTEVASAQFAGVR